MSKELKPKIYHVVIGSEQMLVKAKTRQGAINHAAQEMVTAEYADQGKLVELTLAGVKIVDISANPAQQTLPIEPFPS